MIDEIWSASGNALNEALSNLIRVALGGGLITFGVFAGRALGVGFSERKPSRYKVIFVSMPIAVLIAAFFAFWSYKGVVNPGETRTEALYDAQLTFYYVLVPLWAGCIWAIFHPADREDAENEMLGGQEVE